MRVLRKLLQGESPPTAPMNIVERLAGSPYANPIIQVGGQDASARKTLDFALNLAETMFRYGAGALEVETSIIAVTASLGLSHIDVEITNQSVVINYAPKDATPITVLRVVRSWTNNYAGLSLVHQLVTDIVKGGVSRQEAINRLTEITRSSKPFPKWMVTFSLGVFAATIVAFMGGSPLASLVAFLSSIAVGLVSRQFARWRIPDFFTTATNAALVTFVAVALWALEVPITPGIVVAGGIILLLPTGRLVSATQDAINGFPVTAAGRYLSAFLTFAAIVSGIGVGLVAMELVGAGGLDVLDPGPGGYPFAVQALLVIVAAASMCISEQTSAKMLLPTGLVALCGFLIYEAVGYIGIGDRLAPAAAAVAIGFAARLIALRLGSPQLVMAVPAVMFLWPGMTIFRSMYELTVNADEPLIGVLGLFNALTVILGTAGGTVLGDHLAHPLTRGLGSNERRARTRRR